MRVLSLVHEPTSTGGGGLFEEVVVARGDVLERCVMPETTTGPDAAESYDAIMVFGGAMHPDQDAEHPWLADESAFLSDAIDREVPLLGVCLGAQLIARAAGAGVGRARRDEVGWHVVEPNAAGRDDPCSASCRPASRRSSGTTTTSSCPRAPSSSPRTTPPVRPTASASARGACSSTPR